MFTSVDLPMPDGGPHYSETDFSLFIVEPYNTLTAFIFVVLGLYWVVRLSDQTKTHTFLFWMSVLLLTGAVGGTIYHGFRKWPFFLAMDWMPIMLIILFTVYYCLYQVLGNHLKVIPAFLGFIGLQYLGRKFGPEGHNLSISVNYILMAIMVLIPIFLYSVKTNYKEVKWVVIALFCFVVAIGFRMADHSELLPMGTHFLWHVFGAAATHSMFWYLYEVRRIPKN
ncbi:MAG: hypothetical protein K9H61_09070 [Bacteroidia bacterium]|nr:hypothetical protein [Bacteroidia bacterium]MCF8427036.1 hypothetical protein [Bacteroidia bacterium]MCF8447131.1 hypothetical protein [Bacteroidia bacterium]